MWHPQASRELVSGLRTRFVPRARLGQGVITMAPWLDLVLIIVFFLLLRERYLIEPGVVMELPTAPVRGGAPAGMVAMVLSLESGQPGVREEIVVFNDQRYRAANEAQMALLEKELRRQTAGGGTGVLLLEADARVTHGTLVRLYAIAREAGLREVNVAARGPR